MNIYVQERKTGKTTKCIMISHNTGFPILCRDNRMVKILINDAKKLGISIPEPLCVDEVLKGGIEHTDFIVDELNYLLDKCLPFNIIAATHTNDYKFSGVDDGHCLKREMIYVLTLKNDFYIGNKVFKSLEKMDLFIMKLPKNVEILNIQSFDLGKEEN